MEHLLTFEWLTGSAADNMTRVLRELDIPYERNPLPSRQQQEKQKEGKGHA